ncbi:hypothetical protein JCM1841_002390 [Sporobolomyces salmonicolor]
MSANPPSFFPTYALDQAFCGVTAGLISTLCMQPLDLLKVQLQVDTASKTRSTFGQISWGFKEIVRSEGMRGLYRGVGPNLVGNASSWGLYFLWYTEFKARMHGDKDAKLNAGQHLLASAASGIVTAIITNPLWVVKTRMYTTSASSPSAYRGVMHGLYTLAREEGFRGMSKGMTLALIGVSNGAVQFMTYEELKKWRVELRRRRLGQAASEEEVKRLSNTEYILMSGSAKLVAIAITYPYQVIRSRVQYQPTPTSSIPPYTSIPDVIRRTYAREGFGGFYKGIATNAVRILPGTCVTFVVYEQTSRLLARPSTPPPRNPARCSLASAQTTPTAHSRSTAATPGSSSSTTALPQRSSPLIGGSLAKRKPPHGRTRSKAGSISLTEFASGAAGPGPTTVGTVTVASPSTRAAKLPSTTSPSPSTTAMARSRSPSPSGRRSPSPSADPSDSDDLSRLSRERLVALLRQTQGDLTLSQDRVELLEQGQRGQEDERRTLERELEGARTRADELLAEEGRMEEELAGRIEVLEKLRATVRELERDKREATKRYREQADSFDSERQAWYDQEQHYKVRIANLSSSSRLRSRGGARPSLSRADEGEENHIEANGTSENEPQSDAEGIDEPKTPTTSHLPPRSSTVSPSPSSLSASSTPSQPTSASDQPTATELALRAQLDSLSTAHTSLTTTLRTLQTEMTDLKRVYQDLQEENESYEILLGEKTLSGEVTASDFFRRSYTWGDSGGNSSAAGGWSGFGFEGGLEAVGEEELEDGDDSEEDSEGSDSDGAVGEKVTVEDDGEGSEDIEAILLESKGTGSLNSGAVSATSPNPSRRRSRRQASIAVANAPHKKHTSLPSAGMVPSSSGLDLAAELEMAQKTEEMDEVDQEQKREREERRKRRREEKERKKREKRMLGRRESSELQLEIKQLREANKALTLYVSKIVDRVCSQEGFEKVLAVDYRGAPVPKTAADISPELAKREPPKKVRPSSGFFGRAAQESSTLTTATAQSVGLSATPSYASSVASSAAPGPRKSGGLSWDGISSVFGFGSSSSAASTTSAGAALSRSTTLTSTPSYASHASHSSISAPGMKPLILSAEGAPRKLDVDEEDEEDMRERERLRAEMAQHGIAYAPALALAGSASSGAARPRLSPRFSSSSGSSTASSFTPPAAAVADKQLKTLERQEEEAKAELKEGRSSGFTEPPQRRMSRIERRSSTRSSMSLPSGGSLGLGIKDGAGEAPKVVESPAEGDTDAAGAEADGPIGKALKRLSRGWTSPSL